MKSIPRSTNHPIIMFNPSSEEVKTPEGKYVFVGQIYGLVSINKNAEKVQELLHLFPRLNPEQLLKATDGVYTWLLYSVNNSDEIQFICTEVVAPFEIGTRHQSLVYNSRVNAAKIYGGGELIKKGESIEFNLLSGTYSMPLIQSSLNRKATTNMIVGKFKTFFPDAEYDNSRDSYIHRIRTVSNDLLEVYKNYGYVVRFFDTRNEWANFNNSFWNFDFKIEYYKKKVDETTEDKDKKLFVTLYMQYMQMMIDLLEKTPEKINTKGGRRKTLKRRK